MGNFPALLMAVMALFVLAVQGATVHPALQHHPTTVWPPIGEIPKLKLANTNTAPTGATANLQWDKEKGAWAPGSNFLQMFHKIVSTAPTSPSSVNEEMSRASQAEQKLDNKDDQKVKDEKKRAEDAEKVLQDELDQEEKERGYMYFAIANERNLRVQSLQDMISLMASRQEIQQKNLVKYEMQLGRMEALLTTYVKKWRSVTVAAWEAGPTNDIMATEKDMIKRRYNAINT